MTNQILTAEILYDVSASLDGASVTIDGLLVVAGEFAHIEVSGQVNSVNLSINDPTLIGRLLDEVPCYLGGDYLYRDSVRLVGVIAKVNNGMVISKIESGVLSRDGESFSF